MQAIVTRWLGPTNHRGSRIVAKAAAGKITIGWDYALGIEGNHVAAAEALADKLGWDGVWLGGGMPSDDGFVFVAHSTHISFAIHAYEETEAA